MSSARVVPRARPTKSRWFDPRLTVGIALVVASVAGVAILVTSVDRTVTVYAAGSTLAPGDVVTAEDLLATQVRPGAVTERYLDPGDLPGEGVVVTRTVGKGELVPSAAVGDHASDRWASVVLATSGDLPRSVAEGATVDVWAVRSAPQGVATAAEQEATAPAVIATEATVIAVKNEDSMVAGRAVVAVELVVPRERVARILQSKAAGDFISLVPTAVAMER